MPTNHTPNYQLSQWEKSDQVRMEDFNADNAKIDGAIKAEADARAAADAAINAALSKLGNCQIYHSTYTGTGYYGVSNPTTFTFPGLPLFAIITDRSGGFMLLTPGMSGGYYQSPGGESVTVSWSGNTASWYGHSGTGQMNNTILYHVFAFYAKG